MLNRTQTYRWYRKAYARMSRGDGYQPYGYDMPTLRACKPGWYAAIKRIATMHNAAPVDPRYAK